MFDTTVYCVYIYAIFWGFTTFMMQKIIGATMNKRLSKTALLTFAISALVQSQAHAQEEDNDKTKDSLLEYVIVVGDESYLTKEAKSASRLNVSLDEVPINVQSVNSEVIADFQLLTQRDALQFHAAVDDKKVRGFNTSEFFRNGFIHLSDTPGFLIERTEIVRGANAVLNGPVTPGGAINVITKQARIGETFMELGSYFGQADERDNYGVNVDTNIDLSDTLAFRFVGGYQNDTGFGAPVDNTITAALPSIQWQVGENTLIDVEYYTYRIHTDRGDRNFGMETLVDNPNGSGRIPITLLFDEIEPTTTFYPSNLNIQEGVNDFSIDINHEASDHVLISFGFDSHNRDFEFDPGNRPIITNANFYIGGLKTGWKAATDAQGFILNQSGARALDADGNETMIQHEAINPAPAVTLDNYSIQRRMEDLKLTNRIDQWSLQLTYIADEEQNHKFVFGLDGFDQDQHLNVTRFRGNNGNGGPRMQEYVLSDLADLQGPFTLQDAPHIVQQTTSVQELAVDFENQPILERDDVGALVYRDMDGEIVEDPAMGTTTQLSRTLAVPVIGPDGQYVYETVRDDYRKDAVFVRDRDVKQSNIFANYHGRFFDGQLNILAGLYLNDIQIIDNVWNVGCLDVQPDCINTPGTPSTLSDSNKVLPQVGFVYYVDSGLHYGIYGNYSESQLPDLNAPQFDEDLPLRQGEQVEFGLKFVDLFDGKFSFNIGFFEITESLEQGLISTTRWDPDETPTEALYAGGRLLTSGAVVSDGTVRGYREAEAVGIDMDFSYFPTDNWSIIFSFATVETEILESVQQSSASIDSVIPGFKVQTQPFSNDIDEPFTGNNRTLVTTSSAEVGRPLADEVDQKFAIWSKYDITDAWTVGGGFIATGERVRPSHHGLTTPWVAELDNGQTEVLRYDPSTRLDLFASYTSENYQVSLNLRNLTEEDNLSNTVPRVPLQGGWDGNGDPYIFDGEMEVMLGFKYFIN